MDADALEAVAASLGGVVAWTAAHDDPMIEEVVQAVVVRVERVARMDGEGTMVAMTISDGERQQTYVMRPSAWMALTGEEPNDE